MYVINKKEKIYSTVVLLSVASHRGQVQTQGPGPAGDWTWTYNLGLGPLCLDLDPDIWVWSRSGPRSARSRTGPWTVYFHLAKVWDFFLDYCITQCPMPVSHVWSYICLQVIVNLCLVISLYMHELWWTCLSCKSNNITKHHHMWSSDLLHFTLYYMLFVPQNSNLFLNISYGSVFHKMCYITWLWCHKNMIHVIKIYHIRKDGEGWAFVEKKKKLMSCQNFPFCHPLDIDTN